MTSTPTSKKLSAARPGARRVAPRPDAQCNQRAKGGDRRRVERATSTATTTCRASANDDFRLPEDGLATGRAAQRVGVCAGCRFRHGAVPCGRL